MVGSPSKSFRRHYLVVMRFLWAEESSFFFERIKSSFPSARIWLYTWSGITIDMLAMKPHIQHICMHWHKHHKKLFALKFAHQWINEGGRTTSWQKRFENLSSLSWSDRKRRLLSNFHFSLAATSHWTMSEKSAGKSIQSSTQSIVYAHIFHSKKFTS